jgi:hypothetical protein
VTDAIAQATGGRQHLEPAQAPAGIKQGADVRIRDPVGLCLRRQDRGRHGRSPHLQLAPPLHPPVDGPSVDVSWPPSPCRLYGSLFLSDVRRGTASPQFGSGRARSRHRWSAVNPSPPPAGCASDRPTRTLSVAPERVDCGEGEQPLARPRCGLRQRRERQPCSTRDHRRRRSVARPTVRERHCVTARATTFATDCHRRQNTAPQFAMVSDDGERFVTENGDGQSSAPIAFGLEGRCSIQLSYGRVLA